MIDIIQKSELFNGIDKENIEQILKHVNVNIRSFKKDEIIHHQEEVCTSLSIVISGEATIQTISSNGNILVLSAFKEGDIFAEALLFAKENIYPAEVVAISDLKVIEFTKDDINIMMVANSKFAENIVTLLSNKIVLLKKKISLIEGSSIRQKICRLLLQKQLEQNSLSIKIISKKQLAEELGIPRPSFSRELIQMKNEKIIDYSLKEIKILNIEAVKENL